MNNNPTTRGQHIALLAQLLGNHARRYDEASRRCNDARGATKGGNSEPVSGSREPSMPTLSRDITETEHDHHQFTVAYRALIAAEKTMAVLVARWAAVPADSVAQWCESHMRHDMHEPRSGDGSRNCDWCANVKRNYGKLPTKHLAELHAQGRRISDNEYRRLLGKGAA